MAINTYATLQTAVSNWLNRTDLTSRIPEFISLAEARIARRLRVRGVVGRSTTTLVVGQQYYALPSDFLEARNVQINSTETRVLSYRSPQQMDYEYPSTSNGVPKVFTIIGDEMQLKPIPEAADTMEIAYYAKLAALTASNTTNWLTTNAPDLLLYGSLIEAESFLFNDGRIALWKTLFEESISEWDKQERIARHSGSALEIRGDTGNP